MKRLNFYIVFLPATIFLALSSCNENKATYRVKGVLKNVNDSMFFAARESGDSLHVDTVRVNKKGEFLFEGQVDTLTVISLYFRGRSASPYIMVDKGWTVEVKGDVEMSDLILAQGGAINNDLSNFKNDNYELLKERSQLVNHRADISVHKDSVPSKDVMVGLKNTDFELLNIASNYIKHNPSKITSVILISNFFKNEGSLERLSESLDVLTGAAYDFPLAVQLREYRDHLRKSAVNSTAPYFNVKDIDGKNVVLHEFRGKYLLLSFVSTTCDVCNDVRPNVVAEYKTIKDAKMNIEFLSIIKDIEDKPIDKKLKPTIKWKQVPVYGGWSSKFFEDYNITEIPYNILIDKSGKIVERNTSIFNLKIRLEGYSDIKE